MWLSVKELHMKKTQIVNLNKMGQNNDAFSFTTINRPESFDDYEINFINLNDPGLWQYNGDRMLSVNAIKDLEHIGKNILASKSLIVIQLPQNVVCQYSVSYSGDSFYKSVELKDAYDVWRNVFKALNIFVSSDDIRYEITTSRIGEKKVQADFCFKKQVYTDILIESETSKRITAIRSDNIILTSLNLEREDDYIDFIENARLIVSEKSTAPKWFESFRMFNDEILYDQIKNSEIKIKQQQVIMEDSKNQLDTNNRIKSIVYTTGEELAVVVKEILEEITGAKCTDFEDVHIEDYRFEINGKVFIGEIKGVGKNVQNSYISQLVNHRDICVESNEEITEEDVNAALIVNHQRNVPVDEREPVNSAQIDKAKRENILIIETPVLLNLLDKYRKGLFTRESIISMLSKEVGILELKE